MSIVILIICAVERRPDASDAIKAQREAGFVGLKAIFPAKPYDDPSYMAHYAQAAELGMPILFRSLFLWGNLLL